MESKLVRHAFNKWKNFWDYSNSIPLWKKYFGNFLVIHYDDICADPVSAAQKMLKFVGTPTVKDVSKYPSLGIRINEGKSKAEIPPQYFEYLKNIFLKDYKNWQELFMRPPKYWFDLANPTQILEESVDRNE